MDKICLSVFACLRVAAAASLLPLCLVACGKSGGSTPASNFSDTNRTVMNEYEDIRAALAADDLRAAKNASAKLATTLKPAGTNDPLLPMREPAETIANAPALDRARQSFKTMSLEAIRLTSGVNGYYVINCPMTPNGDWVQTTQAVDNPYLGKIMHDCGVVKK